MRIKSYFTDSVQEAIEHARAELGSDVMLMNSKKTEPELRALGTYEVVFGVASDVASASSTVLSRKTAMVSDVTVPEKKRAINSSGGINKGLAALLAATQPAFVAPVEVNANAVTSNSGLFGHIAQDSLSELMTDNSTGTAQSTTMPGRSTQGTVTKGGTLPPSELSRELADLREQIEAVKRSMLQARDWSANGNGPAPGGGEGNVSISEGQESPSGLQELVLPSVREVKQQLADSGFSEAMAAEIADAVGVQLSAARDAGATTETREAALYNELSKRFRVQPGFSVPGRAAGPDLPFESGRAVLFAGPAGSGKTTSLLKLALRHSFTEHMPVQILSLDTLRVGGWEQLAAYARIAGLPFNVVHNPAGLGQALAEHRGKKLILIDTPGLSSGEWRETQELAASVSRELTRDNAFEVQLVLPATLRPAIARRALAQFSALQPAKLLLTHMDEVDGPGVALELAICSGLPLSYLASGQQIPEDLEDASQERLLEPFAFTAALSPQVATAA